MAGEAGVDLVDTDFGTAAVTIVLRFCWVGNWTSWMGTVELVERVTRFVVDGGMASSALRFIVFEVEARSGESFVVRHISLCRAGETGG